MFLPTTQTLFRLQLFTIEFNFNLENVYYYDLMKTKVVTEHSIPIITTQFHWLNNKKINKLNHLIN